MNRLNFFAAYDSKLYHHEDQLTRVFLVVLRYIPLARSAFLDVVREKSRAAGNEHTLPSFSILERSELLLETQKETIDEQDSHLLSIGMTDENWTAIEDVEVSGRGARYDGLIYYRDQWILVIENKPFFFFTGAEEEQLRPSLPTNTTIRVERKPVLVTWREVIDRFNGLLESESLSCTERMLLNDFLSFIDEHFPFLNPFDRFSRCKDNEQLLNRRCEALLNEFLPGRVAKSWAYYADLDGGAAKMVFLYAENRGQSWELSLEVYPGNNKPQSIEFFTKVDVNRFLTLEDSGWKILPMLTFSSMGQNLAHSYPSITAKQFCSFWRENLSLVGQYRRVGDRNFSTIHDTLQAENQLTSKCQDELLSNFLDTNRQVINVIAGFRIIRSWTSNQAVAMDNKGEVAGLVRAAVQDVLSTWNQSLPRDGIDL